MFKNNRNQTTSRSVMKKLLIFAVSCFALIAATVPQCVCACTSWMVFSDLTKNGTNILHKNRDAAAKKLAIYLSNPSSPRKWVALSNDKNIINSGINASGLAGAMNSGELCIDPPNTNKDGKGTPKIMWVILESCDTARQAVDKLKEILKSGDYNHGKKGSTFFFCDPNEGYVCEITAKHCSVQKIDNGYTVRANIWQNPGMYALSRNTIKGHLNSSARAYMAIYHLNQAIDKHGKVTLPDIFDASRHCKMPKESSEKRSLCGKNTNSGCTVEIDKENPDVLSVLYATIGPPRNTIYVPVPVCAEKIHPAMGDLKWSTAAWKRFDKLTYAAEVPAEWTKFEIDSVKKMNQAKENARKLLKAGKRTEAVKLMNSTAEAIWLEAAKLLNI